MKLIPGAKKMMKNANVDESQLTRVETIIGSMTGDERKKPELLEKNSRRRKRIANGSGYKVADVNRLIESLKQQKQTMKKMGGMDPSKIDPNNPMKSMQGMQAPTQKKKKGKGKGKGGFRF